MPARITMCSDVFYGLAVGNSVKLLHITRFTTFRASGAPKNHPVGYGEPSPGMRHPERVPQRKKPTAPTSAAPVPLPAVLFDLDGTLIDSNYQHVNAWAEALRSAGIVIPT